MADTQFKLIEFDEIDSTNNYAMKLINDDNAEPGLTIVARKQTAGKGQRDRKWTDEAGKSLLMSIVVCPKHSLEDQFAFNAAIVVSIANVLQNFMPQARVRIKWPNDLIINDKKAGGLLIENVLHGSQWKFSIVGLGLNVMQAEMGEGLPNATSLYREGYLAKDLNSIREVLCQHIMAAVNFPAPISRTMDQYNRYLYKRNELQVLEQGGSIIETTIVEATEDGRLRTRLPTGENNYYVHGSVSWVWPTATN